MEYSLFIRGIIGWDIDSDYILDFLKDNAGKRLDIAVSSKGGSVIDALEIYQGFKDHGDVHVHIMGAAASAATFLALGAKTVDMVKNSLLLIHNASAFIWKCTSANKEKLDQLLKEFQTTRDNLNTVDEVIASIYAEKSGKSLDVILSKMKEEKWMTAKQALEFGLIDSIRDDDESVKLSADAINVFQNFNNSVNQLPALPVGEDTKPVEEAHTSIADRLRNFFTNFKNKKAMKHVFKALCAVLGCDSLESANDVICLPVADVQKLEDKMNDLVKKTADADKAKEVADKAKDDLQTQLTAAQNSLKEKEEEIKNLKGGAGADEDSKPDSTGAKDEEMSCEDLYNTYLKN